MTIIKIHKILVDMILGITPVLYGPYVTTDKKIIKKMVTQCRNAIYVTMVASLLYYCKFCMTLKLNKFKMNPYHPCVANLVVNGSQ